MATCKYCGKWFEESQGYSPFSISGAYLKSLSKTFLPGIQVTKFCSRPCHDRYNNEYSNDKNTIENINNNKNSYSHKSKESLSNKIENNNKDIDYKDVVFRLKDLYEDIYEQDDTKQKEISIKKIIEAMQTSNITSACFNSFEDKEYFNKFQKSLIREHERLCRILNE